MAVHVTVSFGVHIRSFTARTVFLKEATKQEFHTGDVSSATLILAVVLIG